MAPSSVAPPIVLYVDTFWISPYAFSAFVSLREKGLSFDIKEVALHQQAHREPEYESRSITGRVPALQHGDFWLAESNVIDDYLEEAFPPPKHARLFPEGLRERARARQVMAWIRSDLMALREERPTSSMFYEHTNKPLSAKGAQAAATLFRVAELLIPPDGGPMFGAWSIADADLALVLHRLILNGDPVPARVLEYAQAQWKRPSVREYAAHARPPFQPF